MLVFLLGPVHCLYLNYPSSSSPSSISLHICRAFLKSTDLIKLDLTKEVMTTSSSKSMSTSTKVQVDSTNPVPSSLISILLLGIPSEPDP